MASTKFLVVYSKNTGRIRWIMRSDDDSEHALISLKDGEAMLELENEKYGNHLEVQEHVNRHTGTTPENDRYAIVHPSGEVVGVIFADPLCGDSIEGHNLIPHETADVGWKHDKVKGFSKA